MSAEETRKVARSLAKDAENEMSHSSEDYASPTDQIAFAALTIGQAVTEALISVSEAVSELKEPELRLVGQPPIAIPASQAVLGGWGLRVQPGYTALFQPAVMEVGLYDHEGRLQQTWGLVPKEPR